MSDEQLLTIIIPTLNESKVLPTLLADLASQQEVELEVIIADGGSSDNTKELVEQAGQKLVTSQPGRAKQMNSAAAVAATESMLLFLHADSELPDPNLLCQALKVFGEQKDKLERDQLAGHFSLRFARSKPGSSLAYLYYEEKTKLNRVGTTNGDQGLLISKPFFDELGGFDEAFPFLEDQILAEKIRKAGQLVTLPGSLTTSARRFEKEGFARRMILSAMIMGLHAMHFKPFFDRAPQIYKAQTESDRLQLAQFFKLYQDLAWSTGLIQYFRNWLTVGRYVRQNMWQHFFFVDVVLRKVLSVKKNHVLAVYDRFVRPITDNIAFDLLGAIITFTWFMLSWGYFAVCEKGNTGAPSARA
ncbi:TIGR04283 family arsenosugar biosynthesis glycosyltransferase [Oligoflexia bacterium]|nr:TIGR04283 family arsenosugar biosynthesis glycosyltransferase [Oligoflexia bacterium]